MQTGAGLKEKDGGTPNQFKSAIFFGSPSRKNSDPKTTWTYEEPSSAGFTLKQTRVGIAYFGRMFQYKFGSVISPPNVDAPQNPQVMCQLNCGTKSMPFCFSAWAIISESSGPMEMDFVRRVSNPKPAYRAS